MTFWGNAHAWDISLIFPVDDGNNVGCLATELAHFFETAYDKLRNTRKITHPL